MSVSLLRSWQSVCTFACVLWRYSLCLSAPVVLVFSLWLGQSIWRFHQHELAVKHAENVSLSTVMNYQAALWRAQFSSRWWPRDLPSTNTVQHLQLFVAQKHLRQLNRSLPQSGKEAVPAGVSGAGLCCAGFGHSEAVLAARLRYHGNAPLHWRGDKRSLHIKLEKNQQFLGVNEFDLVVPSTQSVVDQYLAYRLAQTLHLLQPRTAPVWLSINGEPAGLYVMQAPISEQTLLESGQMPGDIYAGDVAGSDAFSAADNYLFSNAGLWQKLAANADYPEHSRLPLTLLIDLLQQRPRNYSVLRQLLDYESFARFHVFNVLSGRRNLDDFHNWRLYFDHARGRFLPMVWDVEAWPEADTETAKQSTALATYQNRQASSDVPSNRHAVDAILLADPVFQAEVKRQYQALQNSGALPAFVEESKQLLRELPAWLAADPYLSLDLDSFSVADFVDASGAMIKRMELQFDDHLKAGLEQQVAPTQSAVAASTVRSESAASASTDAPENIQNKTPQRWHGQLTLHGIQHFHQPVQIESGTRLLLGPWALLVFHAPLRIEGSAQAPVVISALDPAQSYAAIVLAGPGANGSHFQHCELRQGSAYKDALHHFTAMVSLHEVDDVVFEHCRFHSKSRIHSGADTRSDDLVHAVYSSLQIRDSEFTLSSGDGLDLEQSHALIERSVFEDNAKEGLDTMASTVVVRDSRFSRNQDKALSIGQRSLLRLENSVVQDNKVALLVKDTSALRVSNSTLHGNQEWLRAFNENTHYAQGGSVFIYHSRLLGQGSDAATQIKLKANSTLALYDSHLMPALPSNTGIKGLQWDAHSAGLSSGISAAGQERISRTKLVLSSADQALFQALDEKVPPVFFDARRGAQAYDHD